MTIKVSLFGGLPDPEMNGLAAAAPEIYRDMSRQVMAIVLLKARNDDHSIETDDHTLKMGIVHIETIGGSDENFVASIMRQAMEKRTGITQLDGFEKAFGQPHPEEGELGD